MTILLRDIWPIENIKDFKIHFARKNREGVQPLDVWTHDKAQWQKWQEYRPGKNDFNRPLIFSLIQYYHETDTWLFGGVFRVLARHHDRYEVELTNQGDPFIGRLKLRRRYRERTTRTFMENHYSDFEVHEILRETYSGRSFPGFNDIDLSFEELTTLILNDRADWRAALGNVKGIYLITDCKTGRRYVGSAYGDQGIWSRWRSYVDTGHGGNVELRKIIGENGPNYFRSNFRIALLEHLTARTSDETVISRENFWKSILLTRGSQGLNRN